MKKDRINISPLPAEDDPMPSGPKIVRKKTSKLNEDLPG